MELRLDLNKLSLDELELVVRLAKKTQHNEIEHIIKPKAVKIEPQQDSDDDESYPVRHPIRRNRGLSFKEIKRIKREKYALVYDLLKKHPKKVFRETFEKVFKCKTYGEAYNEFREYCKRNKLEVLGIGYRQSIRHPTHRKPNKFRVWASQHYQDIMATGLDYKATVRKLAEFWKESQSNEQMAN